MKTPLLLILSIAFLVKPTYQAAKAQPVSYASSENDCYAYVR